MERGIGEFVVQGTPLVSLAQNEPLGDDIIADLQNAYGIDRHRTVEQDSGFGIRQLLDMALGSLSPGINDTTTAVMCVDYRTAILSRRATRDIPSSHRYEDGELRVIAMGPTFSSLVAESFDQIRGSAQGNLSIMLRMLGALHTISSLTDSMTRSRSSACTHNALLNWQSRASNPSMTATDLTNAMPIAASPFHRSAHKMLQAQPLNEDGKDDDHVGHGQHDLAFATSGQG